MNARPDFLEGERLPRPARQRRSIDKRGRLMNAALDLFAAHGYAGTSIDSIAARANLAIGTFYQHFESKRQLLLALMDRLLEELSGVSLHVQPSTANRAALRGLLSRALERDLACVGAYRAWQEAIISDPELSRKNAVMHAWTRARVLRLLRVLQRAPGARRARDLATLADVLDGFLWGLMSSAMHMDSRERNRRVDVATDLIYRALFSDDRPSAQRAGRRKP